MTIKEDDYRLAILFQFFSSNGISLFSDISEKSLSLRCLTISFYKMDILISVIIGVLAGFLAGKIMRGGGFGFLINLLVGILGGILGGCLLGWLGIHWGGWIGTLVTAVIGAVVLLWILSLFKKK